MAGVRAVDSRVTFAELQHWPDDGRRYELYDGEVIIVPAPLPRHQRVALHIAQILNEYERATGGLVLVSPIDVVLSEHNVVQPDVIFFRRERRHLIDMMQAARVPPDLAVEVLSRTTETRDRGRKMDLLARFGVVEYWIVDPVENTLEVYVLEDGGYRLAAVYGEADRVHSPTLANLDFDAARVFEL
jgi:Uma2 family endonuclease